jgi:hypothetical protein
MHGIQLQYGFWRDINIQTTAEMMYEGEINTVVGYYRRAEK